MDAKHIHLHIYTAFYDAIYDNMTQTYDTVAVIAENVPQTHGHWLVHHNNDPTTRVCRGTINQIMDGTNVCILRML